MRVSSTLCASVLGMVIATVAGGHATAEPMQGFYVVHINEDLSGIMAVSLERVTTSTSGHKIFPIHAISDDGAVDTTVVEVDCPARRRRVISETLLFPDSNDPIDKTSQNDLSWQAYGSDAPANELVCAKPEEQTKRTKYEVPDLRAFAERSAATLRRLQDEQ